MADAAPRGPGVDFEEDALMASPSRQPTRTLRLGPLTGVVLDLQALLRRYSALSAYRKQFCSDFETRDVEELRRIYLALRGFNNSYRDFFRDVTDVPPYSKSVLCKSVWLASLALVSSKTIAILNRRLVPRTVRAAIGLVVTKLRRLLGVRVPERLGRRSRVPEEGLENYFVRAIRSEFESRMNLEREPRGPLGRVVDEASATACTPSRRSSRKKFTNKIIVREGVCETVPDDKISSIGQFRAYVVNKARRGEVHGIKTPKALWFIRPDGSVRCSVQEICFAIEAYRNKDNADPELPSIQEAFLESVTSESGSAGRSATGYGARPPAREAKITVPDSKETRS